MFWIIVITAITAFIFREQLASFLKVRFYHHFIHQTFVYDANVVCPLAISASLFISLAITLDRDTYPAFIPGSSRIKLKEL